MEDIRKISLTLTESILRSMPSSIWWITVKCVLTFELESWSTSQLAQTSWRVRRLSRLSFEQGASISKTEVVPSPLLLGLIPPSGPVVEEASFELTVSMMYSHRTSRAVKICDPSTSRNRRCGTIPYAEVVPWYSHRLSEDISRGRSCSSCGRRWSSCLYFLQKQCKLRASMQQVSSIRLNFFTGGGGGGVVVVVVVVVVVTGGGVVVEVVVVVVGIGVGLLMHRFPSGLKSKSSAQAQ